MAWVFFAYTAHILESWLCLSKKLSTNRTYIETLSPTLLYENGYSVSAGVDTNRIPHVYFKSTYNAIKIAYSSLKQSLILK